MSNHAASQLLDLVSEAHQKSTLRANPSTVSVHLVGACGGTFEKAVTAALATIGAKHGPVQEVHRLLMSTDPVKAAEEKLAAYEKVPGWGSSFCKDKIDPDWIGVSDFIASNFEQLHAVIMEVTAYLHKEGLKIFPNPACYTAACAIASGMPSSAAVYVFIKSRLAAWLDVYLKAIEGRQAWA